LLIAFQAYIEFFEIEDNEAKVKKLNDDWSKIWNEIRLNSKKLKD